MRDTGEVFDALSERDGQLRSLITNSNRVFATTAARNRELAEMFRALPTFERESTHDARRLDGVRARTPNPLVTQLRPAARELAPTLQRPVGARARPRGALPRPQPADRRLEGRPAAIEDFLDELHPLLAKLDAPLRQLNPPLAASGSTRTS